MGAATRTLLVVEDEFASLEVLALLLGGEGYRVLTAADGESALELLEHEQVDLVLTDYMMPKMNGIELCERIHHDERLRALPVILMSATYSADIQPSPQIVAYFSKPLSINKVVAAIRKVLGEPT